ncbi:DUF58 domain-containing protein [Halorussus sp. MSC15.2]|uniref:DUF58 domain-containing protein n=1 Tax=Halorussus sp. MSC15.2 TaxID=2283638 RepID=UPI0013D5EC69|nr:DUF58 domain-containing protein [Halorussus sp. MSC15.2]NEU56345.1 DUF58 domain-containing protein [Halorussus sp. MSC15.2]
MITAEFLDELDRFDAANDRNARSQQQGERTTEAVGEGLTFADYRRYAPGDEPRFIDWNLYARTDELYVKQFEAERNFTVHVLVDASASMDFGEGDAHKFEYAAKLGLGFAYLTARDHNEFRFATFGDAAERLDRGRSNRGEVLGLVEQCNAVEPDGEAAFEDALADYAATIDSKALVVVCSDFLGDVEAIDAGLEALASNQVVLAHVVAPEERNLPTGRDAVFEALESDESLRAYVSNRLERSYREEFDAHADSVEGVARDLRARYERIDTGRSFFESFGELWFE